MVQPVRLISLDTYSLCYGGLGHVIQLFFLIFNFGECFFWYLFIVEMDPKDEILLKNEVLPCKNIFLLIKENVRKYKGKSRT